MKGAGGMEPEMKQFYESLDSEEKEFYEAETCICNDDHLDGCYCCHLDRDSARYLDRRLYDSITHDWKDVFVRVLRHIRRRHGGVDALPVERYPLCSIFVNDAVNCLEAVMNGETAGILEIKDVNALPYDRKSNLRVPLLHKAASDAAIRITNFYLPGNEAQINLRIRIHDDDRMGFRPLDLAIQRYVRSMERIYNFESRECISKWTSEACLNEPTLLAIKILFSCSYVYNFHGGEIVTLLASRTLEIEQDFFNYLKERKLLESIILLMLAHDSLMPRIERGSKIRDLVRQEMIAPETPILSSGCSIDRLLYEAKKRKVEMEALILLIEIFDRIGDKIEAHLRLDQIVSKPVLVRGLCGLLKEAGFDVELEPDKILREVTSNPGNPRIRYMINWFKNDDDGDDVIPKCNRVEESNIESNQPLSRRVTFGFSKNVGNHEYHSVGASFGLGSTAVDKVKGVPLQLQVKNNASVRQITSMRSWTSCLQFKGKGLLSAISCRRILWITNKFGRAL